MHNSKQNKTRRHHEAPSRKTNRLAVGNDRAAQWTANGARSSPPRSSALGRRRQMAVAGRRIEGRRFEHALAQAWRQIGGHDERGRTGNLGYAAVTATRAAGAGRASWTVAPIWQDLARLAAGFRVIVMTACDASAPGGMPLGNLAVRVLARMLAVENCRASSVAGLRMTVVVAIRPSRNRQLRALHRHRQEGDQAVGRRQTSPAVGSIKSQCSPSSQEQVRTAATRPRDRIRPLGL